MPQPGFTKYFGGNSVFSIQPCSEVVARTAAAEIRAYPPALLQTADERSGQGHLEFEETEIVGDI